MPTIVEGIINPYNGVGQYKENIADMLDAIDRREVPTLAMLGFSMDADITKAANSLKFPCTQATHTWQNDQLIPNIATLSVAYTAADLSMTLGSGEGQYFYQDEIIAITSGANTSIYRITNVTGDVLSLESLSNDASHVVNTKVYAMGRPAVRGETYEQTGRVVQVSTDTNFTQIFGGGQEGVVSISGTEQATAAYGIQNRLEYETAKKLAELAIRMEQAALFGHKPATLPTGNQQPASRFGGLFYFISTLSGGITKNANGQQLSSQETLIRQALDDAWDAGGNPSIMMMNLFNRSQMSDLLAPFTRTERTDRAYGVVVNTYEYTHGSIDISLNKWLHPTMIFGLSPEYIGMGPLNGGVEDRSFHVEDLPKTGDYHQRVVIGEYTMEVRNRKAAHFLISNLATA